MLRNAGIISVPTTILSTALFNKAAGLPVREPSYEYSRRLAVERGRALAVARRPSVTTGAFSQKQGQAQQAPAPASKPVRKKRRTGVEHKRSAKIVPLSTSRTVVADSAIATVTENLQKAKRLRDDHDGVMRKTHTRDDVSMLHRALKLLQDSEKLLFQAFGDDAAKSGAGGRLQLQGEHLRIYFEIIDLLASTCDDLGDAACAVRYLERLISHDKCAFVRTTNATLEYEYCSGRLFSRAVIMYRHQLNRPDLATDVFNRALAVQFNGERVHWWPNQWQVPTLYMRGLRSSPFWIAKGTKWPRTSLASFLEKHFDVIRDEFLATLARPEHSKNFTQNDHSLIAAGAWGELKLYDGKAWKPPCANTARRTCELLRGRTELVGKLPAAKTHNVNLPKEAGYFKLMPGTKLKAHTGPVNFHLYCHLGLLVPEGSRLRVGQEPATSWVEGKSLCFDDSFDHEAWHDGERPRYVLMVTFLHPDLGAPELNSADVPPLPKASVERAEIRRSSPARGRKRRTRSAEL